MRLPAPYTIHMIARSMPKASIFEHAPVATWVAALGSLPLADVTIHRPLHLPPYVVLFPHGPLVTIDTYYEFLDGGKGVHVDKWGCLHLPVVLRKWAPPDRRLILQWTTLTQHSPHWVSTRDELPTYFLDGAQHFLYEDRRWQQVGAGDERLAHERVLVQLTRSSLPDPHF